MQYKSEIVQVSYRLLQAKIKELELTQLDELINTRASEGWELVTYAFMGGQDSLGRGILVTFKKA